MKNLFGAIWITACILTSCQGSGTYIDNVLAAQVGDDKLTKLEVRSQIPMGLSAADSVAFARQYIRNWVDEHLLYEQGLRNVRDLEQLEAQVADYRRTLVSQNYENQLLENRVAPVSADECWSFYEENASRLKLDRPIVQGIFIKMLADTPQLDKVRGWIKEIQKGDANGLEDLEQFCMQRATAYDYFFYDWIDFRTVMNNVPVTVVEPETFLTQKSLYELTDSTYLYILVIKDYRLVGDRQPYEYARSGIRELLTQRRRQDFRNELRRDLYKEGVKNGTVILYDKEETK